MAYQSRHRRRRKRSHYGVLVLLILLVVIAIPVGFQLIKTGASAAFGGGGDQVVFQLDNKKAMAGDKTLDLEGAPYKDAQSNAVMIPLRALSEELGLTVDWESISGTASIVQKKDTIRVQIGSKTLRLNDEMKTMEAAPITTNGITYVPVNSICEAFSWQVNTTDSAQGDFVIVRKTDKALTEDDITKITANAEKTLGPSVGQVLTGSMVLRSGSDKLLENGSDVVTMSDESKSCAVIEKDGAVYVPLKGGITALGGTAEFDGKAKWNITFGEKEESVAEHGKVKVDGKTVKEDGFAFYKDEENGRFYVSAQVFGALIGKYYNDLGDNSVAYTTVSLEGFDDRKSVFSGDNDKLTEAATAVGIGDIPQADCYVALTFDDGPTGALDDYPSGLTATLLDGLKERGVHATFMMCGYRIKDFNSHMSRYLAEGHELGNHTMDHPDSTLAPLDVDTIVDQFQSNADLIKSYCGEGPTVCRPVGGAVSENVKTAAAQMKYPIINWSLDTEDWKIRDAGSVKSAVLNVGDGDIVLMHDLYPTTVEGVLAAIDELQSRTDKTYAFVTVQQLAAIKGVTMEPGVVYNDFYDSTVAAINDGTYVENYWS